MSGSVEVSGSTPLTQRLAEISHSIRGESIIAARPGQMSRLEALADELKALADSIERGETP